MNTILIAVVSMGAIGVFFAGFLAFASKKFAIEEDPRIGQILEVLPGANCGGCGFPGVPTLQRPWLPERQSVTAARWAVPMLPQR